MLPQLGFQIPFVDLGLARADVAHSPLEHPLGQPVDLPEEMLEGIDDEEQRLVVVDLEVLVDHPIELEGIALYPR